jgi:hypothetical protein
MFRSTALAIMLIASSQFFAPTHAWGQRLGADRGRQIGRPVSVRAQLQADIHRPRFQRPRFRRPTFHHPAPGSRPAPNESTPNTPPGDGMGPGWSDTAGRGPGPSPNAGVLRLAASNIYFHQAGPGTVDSVTIDGWLQGPMPWDTLTLGMAHGEETWEGMVPSGEAACDLSFTWALRYADGDQWSEWMEADVSDHQDAVQWSWSVPNHPQPCHIQLRCGIVSSRYQAPGHYELEIQLRVGGQKN